MKVNNILRIWIYLIFNDPVISHTDRATNTRSVRLHVYTETHPPGVNRVTRTITRFVQSNSRAREAVVYWNRRSR